MSPRHCVSWQRTQIGRPQTKCRDTPVNSINHLFLRCILWSGEQQLMTGETRVRVSAKVWYSSLSVKPWTTAR